MSAETPTPESKPRKPRKPILEPDTAADSTTIDGTAPVVEDPTPADVPVVATATDRADAAGSATGDVASVPSPASTVEPADSAYSGQQGQQIVYVQTPVPPKVRSNRIVGVLLALLGAVIFAVLFALVIAGVLSVAISGTFVGVSFASFLQSAAFWIPVLVFTLAFILAVLILNRAGWWAHVIGSLVVALAVYFGTIGLLLLSSGLLFPHEGKGLTFASVATQPSVIIAAIVAREVSIWIGLAVAARGRRVKARNVESRTAWDKEQADKRAEIERPATSA